MGNSSSVRAEVLQLTTCGHYGSMSAVAQYIIKHAVQRWRSVVVQRVVCCPVLPLLSYVRDRHLF